MLSSWKLCLKAQLQREKMHSARVVKYQRNAAKGLGTPLMEKDFLTPNVNPLQTQLTQWRLKAQHHLEQDRQWIRGKAWQAVSNFSGEFARNQERSVQPFKRCPTL